eukprot:4971350-Pyramimonas_sp.AAC.1
MGKSPCWLGKQSESLTVTDRIVKLSLVCVHGTCCGQRRTPLALALRVPHCPQSDGHHVGFEAKVAP